MIGQSWKVLIIGTMFLLCAGRLYSAGPDSLWHRTYGGPDYDGGHSVQETADGGYIIVGDRETGAFKDVYLVKTYSNGYQEWDRGYGDSYHDRGHAVIQSHDGDYVVAGYTERTEFGRYDDDVYLLKISDLGIVQRVKKYGGTSDDCAWSVQQTSDGGYVIAGYTYSYGAGGSDFYLIKTDANLDTSWTRTYGGASDDVGRSVQETSDGGYIIAGYTKSFTVGGWDVWLVKTDSAGITVWTERYGSTWDDAGYSVLQAPDGGYVVAGYTNVFSGYVDVWLIKTYPTGVVEWHERYGGAGDDYGRSIAHAPCGGYAITGLTDSFGGSDDDVYVIETDAEGQLLWEKTYGGSEYDGGACIQQTSDGGYIIAGTTDSFVTGYTDFYLVKTEPCVSGITGDKRFFGLPIVCMVACNPAKQTVPIKYELRERATVGIHIYSLLGQRLRTLTYTEREAGSYTIVWDGCSGDGTRAAPGVYLIRLQANGNAVTCKALLMR